MEQPERLIMLVDSFYGKVPVDCDDIIFTYAEDQYNHLRYHQPYLIEDEQGVERRMQYITALFLSDVQLEMLAGEGVPETYMDEPTSAVRGAYENDSIARMEKEFPDDIG